MNMKLGCVYVAKMLQKTKNKVCYYYNQYYNQILL